MATEPREHELVKRAAEGDQSALAELLLLCHADLEAHIAARLRGNAAVMIHDDVLQETYVRVAKSICTFRVMEGASFIAWLKTIATNVIRDAARRKQRERYVPMAPLPLESAHTGERFPDAVNVLAGDSTSPSRRAHRRDAIRRVKSALSVLSPDQRDVIERYYLRSQSLDEIAAARGSTKDAIRGISYRAREHLRQLLGRTSQFFTG